MNNLYIVMYFRTLIESKPVGFSHISMQAKVSASGLIKEVMDDEFTFICKITYTFFKIYSVVLRVIKLVYLF